METRREKTELHHTTHHSATSALCTDRDCAHPIPARLAEEANDVPRERGGPGGDVSVRGREEKATKLRPRDYYFRSRSVAGGEPCTPHGLRL